MTPRKFTSILFGFALFLLSAPAGTAYAHGGDEGHGVEETTVGPYHLLVRTEIESGSIPRLHLSASVTEAESGAHVEEAAVAFMLTDPDGHFAPVTLAARPVFEGGERLYEAAIALSEPGSYRVRVEIRDMEGRTGEAYFEVSVGPPNGFTKTLVTGLLLSGIAAMAWLIREGWIIFILKRSTA